MGGGDGLVTSAGILPRQAVLGVRMSAVDCDGAVDAVIAAARDRRSLAASALAVHGVMTGALDRTQQYRLNQLDLLLADGQPVRWALAWLYHVRLPDRVYGPTLMLRLCARAAEERLPVFLFGSRPVVIASLQKRLQDRFPRLSIAGAEPSAFRTVTPAEQRALARRIRDSGAALVFAGLGCPRQEVWTYELRDLLPMPIVAVGAAFEFHAGTLAQAPPALQALGFEWLFRLAHEPRRLWKRYLLLNPLYLTLLTLQRLRLHEIDPDDVTPPARQSCIG